MWSRVCEGESEVSIILICRRRSTLKAESLDKTLNSNTGKQFAKSQPSCFIELWRNYFSFVCGSSQLVVIDVSYILLLTYKSLSLRLQMKEANIWYSTPIPYKSKGKAGKKF